MPKMISVRLPRALAVFLSGVLAATLVQATAPLPRANAANGPSEPLPVTPPVPVSQQGRGGPPSADETTPRALNGDQPQGAASLPGAGNYAATSLSPSATWQVSTQTGDFTWSYPIPVPPAAGGLQPNLALSYSSSAVDGLTSSTNNQASWIGDGWSLWPGFIERSYRGCAIDLGGTGDDKPADLCWHTNNATMSLNGAGSMLIRDDNSGVWKPKNDDGSRIEQITTTGNGDDNGESWKVTTVDGTQYFFGTVPAAKSTWTVPVYGDDANEPCHKPTFAESSCVQGYRWNLDKVVDRHGNMIQYFYQTETNHYGQNKNSRATSYVRGGWLERIDYGLRSDNASIAASGQVHFDVVDRCVPGSVCALTKPDNLPDVPLNLKCDGGSCVDKWSPSFWTTKRLRSITTKVHKGTGYSPVDTWTLRHELPDPGDGEKAALWLKGITHAGLPEVTFDGARKPNRVHGVDGYAALIRFRMNAITSESGGITSINYAEPECRHGSTMPPNAHDNKLRCFPVRWTPKMSPERTDYFHKYVVAAVANHDGIAGTLADETSYEYLDGAAWHFDTSEFVEEDKKTWNEFRGFGRVRTRRGSGHDAPKTMTEQRFYRGMHGDRYPGGTRPPVNVADTEGGVRVDSDWLQGTEFESATFAHEGRSDQPDPPRITKTISVPTSHGPTATRATFKAYIVRTGDKRTYTALSSGGVRTTRTVTSYDTTWGLPTQVNDLGDTALARDDLCTRTTYVPNTVKWLINYPARVETVSVHCGQPATFPDHAVSDVRNSYDNQAPGTAPVTGNVTRLEQAAERPASDPVYVTRARSRYDDHGRVLEATDALGNTTTTAYTPTLGGPTTQTVTRTPGTTAVPAGLVTTTTLDPARGLPTLTEDPNGRRTEVTYDALGRTTEVWLPNRPRPDNPKGTYQYAYQIRTNGPNVVSTTKVGPRGNYTTTNELFDGMLRKRQIQAPAPGGGRLLTDTRYDSHGRTTKVTHPYFNDAPVDTNLWFPFDNTVPGATVTEYDEAGRPDAEVFLRAGAPRWRTDVTYGGDRITVSRPQGGTTTTTIVDARGRETELRQHNPTGFDTTTYAYHPSGQLAQVTDPGRNIWQYDYDLLGRQVSETDPDRGRTGYTYDNADRILTTTDARNVTLAYKYDALGRKTELHRDSLTGPRLADWTYDTVPHSKGQPAASTRYIGSNAYVTRVAAYTPLYRPAKTETVIPTAEGKLAGTYTSFLTYEPDGSLASETYPASGGLPAEGVGHSHDDLGMPLRTWGGLNGSTVEYVLGSDYTRYGEPQRLELGESPKRAWLSYYYEDDTRRLTRTIVDAEIPRPMQADTRYTYDDAGNVTSIADTPRDLPADTQCFRYDHLRRLTEAWTPTTGCATNPSTGTLGGAAPYWHTYTYDNVGNRRTETQHATAGDTTRTYTTTGHRLDTVTTRHPGGTTLDTYGYDPAGHTTRRALAGTEQTLDWDPEGHLTKVSEDGKETSYLYDADGNRLIRREPDATTLYIGKQEIRLDTRANTTTGTRYYTHGEQTIAVRTQSSLSWLGADHHGTALTSINSETLAASKRRQLPFGTPRGEAPPAWPGQRGFVDGTQDPTTGLTHLGAREYDPALGRFMSVDPLLDLTDPQQMHGYTYGNNNPATLSDPDGLCPVGDYENYCAGEEPPRATAPVVTDHGDGVASAYDPDTNRTSVNGVEPGRHAPPLDKLIEAMKRVLRDRNIYTEAGRKVAPGSRAWDILTYSLILQACGEVDNLCSNRFELQIAARAHNPEFDPWADDDEALGSLTNTAIMLELGGGRRGRVMSAKAAACSKNSFTPETLVVLADGTRTVIKDVEVGDRVLATDPQTGRTEAREVTATIVGYGAKELVELTVDTDGDTGNATGVIIATANHPIWIGNQRRWVDAGDIKVGDALQTATGDHPRVLGRRVFHRTQAVHNLTVSTTRTYYVAVNGVDVLVHNCPQRNPDASWPQANRTNSNCDACAARIQDMIGGEVMTIRPRGRAPGLGESKRDPHGTWAYHKVVLKDGRVYDGFTGSRGMSINQYQDQFRYKDGIDFGF